MKFIFIGFVLLFNSNLKGQIQYFDLGEVFADDLLFAPAIGSYESLEEVTDSSKYKMMVAMRQTHLKSIQSFLSPKLKEELNLMDSILNNLEKQFEGVDSIYLFENSGFAVSQTGTLAITKFSHKELNDLIIEYQYYCPSGKTTINKISINDYTFPRELIRIEELKRQTKDKTLSINEKFDLYSDLISLVSPKEGNELNDFHIPQSSNDLSMYNGSLSWYALNLNKNNVAVISARKGLELNPNNIWINTNLALGLAQIDELDEAKKIYLEFKDLLFGDQLYKDVFKTDIKEIENQGIEVKHKLEILELLGN